jgi:hypothetical protein
MLVSSSSVNVIFITHPPTQDNPKKLTAPQNLKSVYIETTEERIYVDCSEDVKYWLSKKLKQLNEN